MNNCGAGSGNVLRPLLFMLMILLWKWIVSLATYLQMKHYLQTAVTDCRNDYNFGTSSMLSYTRTVLMEPRKIRFVKSYKDSMYSTYMQTSWPFWYLHSPLLLQCCGKHCSQNRPALCLLSTQGSLEPSTHSHLNPPNTLMQLAKAWQSWSSGEEHSSKSVKITLYKE